MGYVPAAVTILRKAALALALGALVVAGACAPNGGGGLSAGHMSASLPGKLSKLTLDASNLVVHVIAIDASTKEVVEDKDLINLVAPGDGTYAGDLPDALPVGDYLFTVIFFHKDGSTRTELARTGDIAGTVKEDTTTPIDTASETLTYANDDGDKVLNIDEVDAGTDLKAETPVVALFIDASYVDYKPGDATAEASNVEDTLKGDGNVFVKTFFGITAADFDAALNGADAIAIPDLNADLAADMDAAARASLSAFVGRGGQLIVFRASTFTLNLLNTVFGMGTGAGPVDAAGTDRNDVAASATEFAGAPTALTANNSNTLLAAGTFGNPIGEVYGDAADPTTANASVARIGVGFGRIVFLAWSWFDAAPSGGTQDGGWVEVLRDAAHHIMFLPKVALFTNETYVDSVGGTNDEEATNVQAVLEDASIPVTPFTEISAAELTKSLLDMNVVEIPELENGVDLFADLDTDARDVLTGFVRGGGTMVTHLSNVNTLMETLVNGLFGLSVAQGTSSVVGIYSAGPAADSPFADGPASLPANNATRSLTTASLGTNGRAIYVDGSGNVTVAVFQIGAGKLVVLGWDFFDAAPVGSLDSGWLGALKAAVAYAPGKVALLADRSFVDYFPGASGSEASNVEGVFSRLFGIPVTPFNGVTAPDLAAGIGTRKVLAIPDQELGGLAAGLDAAGKAAIQGFVDSGGTLLVFGEFGTTVPELLNDADLFGFSVARGANDVEQVLDAAAAAGTDFEGGPTPIPGNDGNYTLTVATVEASGGTVLYADAGDTNAGVAVFPVGSGRIVFIAWDWFSGAPVGGADGGWVNVLKRAIAADLG